MKNTLKAIGLSLLLVALGSYATFTITRPVELDENMVGYILQENCQTELPSGTVTAGRLVSLFTHKLRRTQVVVIQCATVEEAQQCGASPTNAKLL